MSTPLQKRKGFRFSVKGAIAGAIVVLGAAVVAWWLWPDASAPVAEDGDGTKKGLIKEVTPAAAPKAKFVEEKRPVDLAATGKPWPDMESREHADIGRAIKELGIRPGMYHYKTVADVFNDKEHLMTEEERNTTLNTSTERQLFVMAGVEPENPMPPMPISVRYEEQDFIDAVVNEIKIWENDTPRMAEKKQRVIAMKKEMQQMIKDGMTLPQAFAKLESEHNRKANLYMLMRGEYARMVNSGDADAEAFREKANATLKASGCSQIGSDGQPVRVK